MTSQAGIRIALCVLVTCAGALGCKRRAPADPGPDVQITSESLRLRRSDPVPRTSPFFDGTKLSLVAARGETIAFVVHHRGNQATGVALAAAGITVRTWGVAGITARRASTPGIYGVTTGTGTYPDVLISNATQNPALVEI